jgi:[acyl-carrier-protein] S-malonyltransferase
LGLFRIVINPLKASEALEKALSEVTIVKPVIPVYSNVDCMPHADGDEIKKKLKQQLVASVEWEKVKFKSKTIS